MAGPVELEVVIDGDGKVRFEVKGAKGRACLEYVELFRRVLGGEVEDQKLTSEFYESAEARTETRVEGKTRRQD